MDHYFSRSTLQYNLDSFFRYYQYIVKNNKEETSSWYAAADLNLDTVVETSPSDRSAYASKLKRVKGQQEDISTKIGKLLNAYTEINKQSPTQELRTALQFEQFAELQSTQKQIRQNIESIKGEISNNSNWVDYKELEETTKKLCKSKIESGEYKSEYESQASYAKKKLDRYKSSAKDLSTKHSSSIASSCTSYISKLNAKAKYAPKKPVTRSYSSDYSYSSDICKTGSSGRYCCEDMSSLRELVQYTGFIMTNYGWSASAAMSAAMDQTSGCWWD